MSETRKPPVYRYLVTGRDARGRRVTDRVEAENGDAAVRAFEDRGFHDVVLHTDDAAAVLSSSNTQLLNPGAAVRVRTRGPLALEFLICRIAIRKFWFLAFLPLGWTVYILLWDRQWDVWNIATIAVSFLPYFFLLFAALHPFRLYVRASRAAGWARWDEVLELLPRIGKSVPKHEWPLRKAHALAGLGRLPKALAELNSTWDFDELPEFMYWAFRGVVQVTARDPVGALDSLRRAYELAPASPVVMVDYASLLLTVRRDTRQARSLLEKARRHAVADTTFPSLLSAEGRVALEEGRPADAVGPLTESIRGIDPFIRGNPMLLIAGAKFRAYLVLALAGTGETADARRHLERARPLLIAHKYDELLERCEQAVGLQ